MIDTTKHSEQIGKALSMLSALCYGRVQWHMSIPAQPDNDPDLVIADGLHAGKELLEALLAAQARIAEIEKELTQPMLVNLSRLADANADLKLNMEKMVSQLKALKALKALKPRGYTDDELTALAR